MAKISKKLVGSVLVADPQGGDPLVLVAGDQVPEGIELGAHVLEPEQSDDERAAAKAAKEAAKAAKAAEKAAKAAKGGGKQGSAGDDLQPPPLTGAGSGTAAWRDYALAATAKAGLQIDFAEDVKRADIVAALQAANIATE